MPTIKDVAKLAGVSTATVSATINGTAFVSLPLKQRVEKAIRELGYTPDGIARSLKMGMTNLIGLMVDDVTSPFYTELVEVIEAAAHVEGYSLLLCHTGRDVAKERKYLGLLRTHRVDGIIWAPTGRAEDYPAAEFERFAVPLVFVDRVVPSFQDYDSVLLDNREAGLQATNYLLDLGHRNIAMINGGEHLEPAKQRGEGYQEAMRRRGLPIDPSLILNGSFREAEAFEECKKLLSSGRNVTALLVSNNHMFIGAMRALNQFGLRCPQEISIVSIDDFPLASVLNPRLTTVRQPVREIAEQALRLLLRRLSDPSIRSAPSHLVVEPMLIVRDSCRPV
jgi:LacI family transcriptional regulator